MELKSTKHIIKSLAETPEPHRSKALICYISAYLESGREKDAFVLVEELDKNYLLNNFLDEVEKDETMKKVFLSIMSCLANLGYIKTE